MTFTGEQYNGVVTPPKETEGFTFNHTMLRVKDPAVSLNFYSKILGMTVLRILTLLQGSHTVFDGKPCTEN